jgi:hypothetical protein
MNLTKEEYQDKIPKCCEFQIVEQHLESLLLCWSITKAIEENREVNCGNCEFNKVNELRSLL